MGGYLSSNVTVEPYANPNWLLVTDNVAQVNTLKQKDDPVEVLFVKEHTIQGNWDRMEEYDKFIWDVHETNLVTPLMFGRSYQRYHNGETHLCFWPKEKPSDLYKGIDGVDYYDNTTDILKQLAAAQAE